MKWLVFLFLLVPTAFFAQEIQLNPKLSVYEFTQSTPFEGDSNVYLQQIAERLERMSYEDVIVKENSISGSSFITESISGYMIKINYMVEISLSSDKSNLLITNFVLIDQNQVPSKLEGVPYTKKRWIKAINSKLPSIIKSLEIQ